MKKILASILALVMILAVGIMTTSCNSKSDYEYIKNKGTLVVGVTVYPPMDYVNENGEWEGFDAELANKMGEELGLNVQFVIIKWNNKVLELKSKNIDCIWNGMTASEELGKEIDFSVSYAENRQVAVIKKSNASVYNSVDSIKTAKIAVEQGSAGHTVAEETLNATNIVPATAQTYALLEVVAGTSDVAIIDHTMASSVVGKGDYADLQIVDVNTVSFEREVFAVGFRKGSDLKEKVDELFKKYYKDGTLDNLLTKYPNVVLNKEALGAL